MSRVGVVLQARMGSSRLPGKVLAPIAGRPMLLHILDRLRAASTPDRIIVATSVTPADDVVAGLVADYGVACYRGDAADVLDRYWQATLVHDLALIVRATADNPLVDPVELDRLVALHGATDADYCHAFGRLPLGVGVESFSRAALARSWREGRAPNHREHVNEYIQERPDIFDIRALDVPEAKVAPHLRLTVDTPEDLERARRVYDRLHRPGTQIRTEEVIAFCAS
ncbi:MAG: glycosyltransferase family protein [Candidatus Sericytochromatia bacterium]|nr:glycosyltransferase family protein [Candidatus Sericytochromatia bacterium]